MTSPDAANPREANPGEASPAASPGPRRSGEAADAAEAADAVDVSDLLAIAKRVAIEAGELVMRRRAEGVAVAATKSSAVDVVTAADRESEALIRARLDELRPGDGFYGEESDPVASTTGIVWVVDPIDGTVNYLYGHPNFAISIAAIVGDPAPDPATYKTLAAVVHAPALGETYTATLGGGAALGGEAIRVSDVTALGQSLVATGFSYDAEARRRQARAWAEVAGEFRDL
ncbi:MAG: inositol monophosphatase family protein, partial [Pseudoclavibacter sp.]